MPKNLGITVWYYRYKTWQYYRLVRRFGKGSFNHGDKAISREDNFPSKDWQMKEKVRESKTQCIWFEAEERWIVRYPNTKLMRGIKDV